MNPTPEDSEPDEASEPDAAEFGDAPDAAELDAMIDTFLGKKPRPIDWARLSGTAAAGEWAALDNWVRWLVRRHGLDHHDVPPCWYEHGDLVEELSALHTAHRAAYDAAGGPAGPAEWLQVLANTRVRLQLSVARTGCRLREHRPTAVVDWASEFPGEDYRCALHAQIERDGRSRS